MFQPMDLIHPDRLLLGTGLATGIVWSLLMVWGLWGIFRKVGRPPWWALAPLVNVALLLEVAGRPAWWFLLLFIPGVNLVVVLWTSWGLAKRFGSGLLIALGLILAPWLMLPWLGWGPRQPLGPTAALSQGMASAP